MQLAANRRSQLLGRRRGANHNFLEAVIYKWMLRI